MRVAVFLEFPPDSGGAYQQSLSTVELLKRRNTTAHEFVVFTQFERTRKVLEGLGIEAIRFRHAGVRLADMWSSTVLGGAVLRRLRRLGIRRIGRHLDAVLDDHRIDIALLNNNAEVARRIGDHPFIISVWDLDHRDHPEFPESYLDRQAERIERVHRALLTRAMAVIANSASGARRIAELYHVDPRRIVVLPFVPSHAVRRHAEGMRSATVEGMRSKYGLPARYLFYPAWYSHHKNHLYILEALVALERRHGIALDAVFCGDDPGGGWRNVAAQATALGVMPRLHVLGLVPDADLPALYEGAVAMTMPSYFGPTNLPPLEAAALGCPVVCSDLPGCREQMGDAALYCDLADPASLADQLAALVRDPAIGDRLRRASRTLAAELDRMDYSQRLSPILDDYAYVSRRWTWPRQPEQPG